jgi:hypothetical protein
MDSTLSSVIDRYQNSRVTSLVPLNYPFVRSITLQLEQCLIFADVQLARADASLNDAQAIFGEL